MLLQTCSGTIEASTGVTATGRPAARSTDAGDWHQTVQGDGHPGWHWDITCTIFTAASKVRCATTRRELRGGHEALRCGTQFAACASTGTPCTNAVHGKRMDRMMGPSSTQSLLVAHAAQHSPQTAAKSHAAGNLLRDRARKSRQRRSGDLRGIGACGSLVTGGIAELDNINFATESDPTSRLKPSRRLATECSAAVLVCDSHELANTTKHNGTVIIKLPVQLLQGIP